MLFDEPIIDGGEKIRALKIPDVPIHLSAVDSVSLPENIDDILSLPEPMAIKTRAPAPVSQKNTSIRQSWFIQIGIFGQESNAKALQKKVKAQGFSTIVTSVSTEKGVLYRVRIGPELDKKRAEAMKTKVDKLNGIKGIIALADE
jgi:DedD protein